ncbi:L-threonylcarbamoyladenylate synthase [Celeribacter neptunius]|uniref:L-threonylcarbamoyladenylate synthase n=1 Tax=Celeribacter neptunius TaxID=588602 RepID=A0A1I3WHY7_9RHOB|nr:L-threonylcarbamoyladenylate synthase [Celeribacter neptunius]SFK06447.1 L-threonylcarbamoyladenylate synthase [Celeribacter neptunius]
MSVSAEQIAKTLAEGGVVLMPTDTVLGLAASPAHTTAVDRIYELKQRPRDKNLPIMVAGVEQIAGLGAVIPAPAVKLLNSAYVPGALTLVLALDPMRAPGWLMDRSEIAIRIPDNALLLEALRLAGPLMVTSANRSGAVTPATTDEARAQLEGTPDLTVPGKGAAPAPSTIVNCTLEPVRIERHGVVTDAEIREVLV